MADTNTKYDGDERVQVALKRMQLSRDYTKPYFDRFLDNYKHYFMRVIDEAVEADSEAYPFYSQIMIPISYQIVETILPRTFSRLPTFSISTEEENDEKDELALKNLIKYQLNHPYLIDDPIYTRLATAQKETFITGNAWGSVPWMLDYVEVEEWQPFSPELGITPDPARRDEILATIASYGLQPKWISVKVKKKAIDAPVMNHHSIFHVFPDAKKKRVGDMGYGIIEEFLTLDEIMVRVNANPNKFKNIEILKKMEAAKEQGSDDHSTNYDQEIAAIFDSSDFKFKDDSDGQGQFKVWFMPEKGGRLSIIVNEKLCIMDGDNPNGDGKLGLFLMKDIPVPHELYAWGEIDPIKRLEDGLSDQFNMRNDSVFYDLIKMWKLDPTSLVDGEEFVPEPGTVVQMKNMDGLQPLETGSTKASSYREYQEWESIIQNVSGVSDYATGQSDPGMNKTLGGVELLQQAANARFQMKLNLFENLGLKAMGTMYVQRNLRYFDTPQRVNADGKKELVTPDQVRRIKGRVHFIVDSGSTEAVSRNAELAKWETITNLVKDNKPPFHNLTDEAMDKVGKKMLYALGESDAEGIIQRKLPEIPATVPPAGGGGIDAAALTALTETQPAALPPEAEALLAQTAGGTNEVQQNPQPLPTAPTGQ